MGMSMSCNLLFLGLDGAGKTTIITVCKNKFKVPDDIATIKPSVGHDVLHFKAKDKKDVEFSAWDVSGREQFQSLWKHYYKDIDAVVWVVDSADSDDRLENSRELLHQTLSDVLLKDAILLVCANKQDLPNAKSASKITEVLDLNKIQKRTWKLQATCAKTAEGLNEGNIVFM